MANDGSISCALRNSSAALGYSKLCSCASPRRNGSCAAGAPELAKATTPTSSCAAPAVNVRKSVTSVTRERMGADRTLFCLGNVLFGGHATDMLGCPGDARVARKPLKPRTSQISTDGDRHSHGGGQRFE